MSDPQFSVKAFGLVIKLDPSFLLEVGVFAEGEEATLKSDDSLLASLIRSTAAAELARIQSAGRWPRADLNKLLRRARGEALQIAEYLDAEAAAIKAEEERPRSAVSVAPEYLDPALVPLVACALGKSVEEANAAELTFAITRLHEAAEMMRDFLRAQGRDLAALAGDSSPRS